MSFSNVLITLFEIALVAVALWAVFHEDLFIAFEEKLLANVRRRRLKVLRGSRVNSTCYPANN